MSELTYFLKFLGKRAALLFVVPLVAMVVCYLLTNRLADTYVSRGRVATGIVDKASELIASSQPVQGGEMERSFDNLIQLMTMKPVLDRVSRALLYHDLTVPQDSMFKKPAGELQQLDGPTRQKIASFLRKTTDSLAAGTTDKLYQARLNSVNGMINDMYYDPKSLLDNLAVERVSLSDYLEARYEGEDPRLTAFVVNTLFAQFREVYEQRQLENSRRSLVFFKDMVEQKRNALDERMNALKNYKVRNNVLNLNEQASGLYSHILDLETRREIAEKDVNAYKAALKNIDQRFNPTDRRYIESALSDANQRITRTRNEFLAASDQYIRTSSPRLKARLDSLEQSLNQQIRNTTDEALYSPQSAKADLVSRKLEMEIASELAQSSIASIDAELSRMGKKYNGLVPDEASIQQMEASIEIASRDYTDALQRYNNAQLESYEPITLTVAERAGLGEKQPSQKRLLTIIAGVAAFLLCLGAFTITYLLDDSVRTPAQLADVTGMPVLGRINRAAGDNGIKALSDLDADNESTLLFKDLVRSIRYEIDEEIGNPKVIAIASLQDQAGKTDLAYGLAWAYERIGQRVLVVDGNFSHPTLSRQSEAKADLSDFFTGQDSYLYPEKVDFLSTAGGDLSLLEIADEKLLREKFAHLKEQYDVVLIETPALTASNQAKEWLVFADRIVAVFAYGSVMKNAERSKLDYLRGRGEQFSGWVLTGTANKAETLGRPLAKI